MPENKSVAPDSHSFYPSLGGRKNPAARTSAVTADMHGMQAIRMGEWKYIDNQLPEELPERRRSRIQMPLELQLYNLNDDPSESANIIDMHPEVVKKLRDELEKIRTQKSSR